MKDFKENLDFIGFHGQTIFHSAKEKISEQLGDGYLLSKHTKKTVIYNFRQNDLKNGGQGAPLTPIFHKLLKNKYKLKLPLTILNIGGVANVTFIDAHDNISSYDIGPGNCLIDQWIRINSKNNYDKDGKIASLGKINKSILNQALKNFEHKVQDIHGPKSYDVKDFDLSFVRGLSLEDGAATLTEYTSEILTTRLRNTLAGAKSIVITGEEEKINFC